MEHGARYRLPARNGTGRGGFWLKEKFFCSFPLRRSHSTFDRSTGSARFVNERGSGRRVAGRRLTVQE
jgi:hypothetical protein